MKRNDDEHVIGATASGKPVYDAKYHKSYVDFTEEEHKEASDLHFKRWEKKWDSLASIYGDTYRGRLKFENNRELKRLETLWSYHSNVQKFLRNDRIKTEKKERRIAKSKVVLSESEQRLKDLQLKEAREFKERKKNLSQEDSALVANLERKLERMKWMHPQDCLNFGVSVAEERRNARNKIKSIINKSLTIK